MKGARRGTVALLCGLALGAGCGPREPGRPPLRVFAASSLTDVVEAVARQWDGPDVVASYGGSSGLARQIRDGAPADVFLSAAPEWVEVLRGAGAIDGEAVVFARNRLVAVAPKGSALRAHDPAELLAALPDGARVAIADAGVPAGEYARAALWELGLLDRYRPVLVAMRDVRAVVHAVELGETEAGFVYTTDASAASVLSLFTIDDRTHPPIEYLGAVLHGSADTAEARRFLDFLTDDAGRSALAAAGFRLP
ncbi:MAG: molybdate ABC transporter substrate-binding protein [Thermoanaerobaculia bacterium]